MAKCRCGREMIAQRGCKYSHLECEGKFYKRIKVGDFEENGFPLCDDGTCHDCGAMEGYYHHVNCDVERCPICGGQLLGCDCRISYAYDSEDKISKLGEKLKYEPIEYKKQNPFQIIRYHR